MKIFTTITFAFSTAFAISHKFGYAVFSFSFVLKSFLMSLCISSLIQWLFMNVWFNFHLFEFSQFFCCLCEARSKGAFWHSPVMLGTWQVYLVLSLTPATVLCCSRARRTFSYFDPGLRGSDLGMNAYLVLGFCDFAVIIDVKTCFGLIREVLIRPW